MDSLRNCWRLILQKHVKVYILILCKEGSVLLSCRTNTWKGGRDALGSDIVTSSRVVLVSRKGSLDNENHGWLRSHHHHQHPRGIRLRSAASPGAEPSKTNRATLQIRFILLPRSKGWYGTASLYSHSSPRARTNFLAPSHLLNAAPEVFLLKEARQELDVGNIAWILNLYTTV